jgi:hypothetical protein
MRQQQHVQPMPHARFVPLLKPSPARHAAAPAQRLRQFFPGDARSQHEHDAVECAFVVNAGTPAARTGGLGRWQQRADALPQLRTDFLLFQPLSIARI